ncbi:MAG: glycosyltransferase family 39 protein [Phycisphaeraceae bacterium]|nr:glycosyltransferase family 39 protein [Phycisphaeraceae bacterium]
MGPGVASDALRGLVRHALIVLLSCVCVHWVLLGRAPFRQSEGHRVAPAWAMLDSGNRLRTEMFELNYVRKPPGMPWAIAASSAVFGRNEFAARFPSALACTLMALGALAIGRAWLGSMGGLAAGLSQAVLPIMWGPGRSAEIEALNTLATQLAVLPLVALLLRPPGDRRAADVPMALLCAAGILAFALTKSAASAPCVVGAIFGACAARRSAGPLVNPIALGAIIVGAAAAFGALWVVARANTDPDAVRETGSFLWQRPGRTALLLPLALAAALPSSLALLWAFGRDAQREGEGADEQWNRAALFGRACGFAWVASCAIYIGLGVDNPRYLMPASVFLAPVVGYAVRGAWGGGGQGPFARGGFTPARRDLLRRVVFRGPAAWCGVLVAAGMIINTRAVEGTPTATGRTAGAALAAAMPDGATVWADDLIEARPDTLLYARAAAAAEGRSMRPVWAKPWMHRAELPPAGDYLLIRIDEGSGEAERYAPHRVEGQLAPIAEGELGRYRYLLLLVVGPSRN